MKVWNQKRLLEGEKFDREGVSQSEMQGGTGNGVLSGGAVGAKASR